MNENSVIYKSAEGARAVEQGYRELLELWPVPNERLTIPTAAGDTFVVACGPADAPPVLLLHGSMSNAATWMSDAATWSRQHRLYAIDMIGEPGLSAPSRPPLDSDAYVRWLDDVMDGLGLERASLVGVSLGGRIAADYAAHRPQRVERLALMCPGGIGRQKSAVLLVLMVLLLFGDRGRRRAVDHVLGMALPTGTTAERALADLFLLIQRNFRPRRRLPVFDDETLRRLTMPVLVILGGRDRMLDSGATRRRIEATVPHAEVRFLPEAGHLIPGQNRAILDFLLDRPDIGASLAAESG